MIALVLLLTASAVLAAPSSMLINPIYAANLVQPKFVSSVSSHDEQWRAVTDGCGQSKSCFMSPENCFVTQNCEVAVSIEVVESVYTFEVQSVGGVYAAVGLSESSSMTDASVVECVNDVASGADKLSLYASYNKAHANVREPAPYTGLALLDSSYDAATKTAWCKFTRAESLTYQTVVFDMSTTQYYLLLAAGLTATADNIGYHNVARVSSLDKRFVADIGFYQLPPVTTTTVETTVTPAP